MVEVRYFAAAADAAGRDVETLPLEAGATVADLRTLLSGRYGHEMTRVLDVAAFLINDQLVRSRTAPLGNRVEILPPFAGG